MTSNENPTGASGAPGRPAGPNSTTLRSPAMATDQQNRWWRTVLGEYPTGITLITTRNPDGTPAGMIVGTFVAVSEAPARVGFLPVARSGNYQAVKANGRFAASVLGANHEHVCRAFSRPDGERFGVGEWEDTPAGLPRLTNAVAWFEGEVAGVTSAGDHDFVQADVLSFGVGDGSAGMPLLYLKGGFGTFRVPSLQFSVTEVGDRMRGVNALVPALEELGRDTGVESLLSTPVGGDITMVAAANIGGDQAVDSLVGVSFPFAPPMGQVFVAWAGEQAEYAWTERLRHLVGRVDRELVARVLADVRERGYGVTLGNAMAERFDSTLSSPDTTGADLAALWADITNEHRTHLDESDGANVTSIQAPVFDRDGNVVFEVVANAHRVTDGGRTFVDVRDAVVAAGREMTRLIGGRDPRVTASPALRGAAGGERGEALP